MTLAERLRSIVSGAYGGKDWQDVEAVLDQLSALADEVEGKVLVKPEIEKIQVGFKFKGRIGKDFSYGDTEVEVAANLQRKLAAGNDLT